MKSKEALNNIRDYNTEVIHDVGSEYGENPLEEECNIIEKDLERLEKQDKILEKLKKPMLYRERKKLGEEYMEWARENNVNRYDLTNIITWCFCFKMREWLDGR